ncbi:Putative oxidoreductase [Podospora comata]|uniref:Oxidoreductase n=1 Tax=Podospora comata TaxID=48703 RepID=A0ABY6S984_PODCO|nr:Putative oxidoreductase [Podospora comata]
MKTIGIFPASGGLGTSTYRQLLALVPKDNVILISRHPHKVPRNYTQAGVRTREASYETAPSDLEKVFAGIDVLFLISYPSHVKDYRIKVQLPAIDAARRAGVKHVFYSSLAFAGERDSTRSVAEVMQAHLATEGHLRHLAETAPGFTYTVIREGIYSESTPIYTSFFDPHFPDATLVGNEILVPHDGKGKGVAWVKRDELGEASAKLIAQYSSAPESFQYVNQVLLLTGNKEWSLEATVKVLGEVAGKDLKIREIPVHEWVRLPQVKGYFKNEEDARTWATAWEAIRQGATAPVTGDLEEILGRKPEEFDVTLRGGTRATTEQ